MGPVAAFVSFRFGASDGVSVVARSWMRVLDRAGFDIVTVTGEPTVATPWPSRVVEGLGLDPPAAETEQQLARDLRRALDDADLVVVENLLTIPLNLVASRAAVQALRGRPTLVHHHDPPWHRDRFAHIDELPATDPAWRHVAINRRLGVELAERGIDAEVIYNGFAPPPTRSPAEHDALRAMVRSAVGLEADEAVLAHPVRAIERKNVPAAISLAEQVDATYWLLGPPEEGYADELARVLARARCRVLHAGWDDPEGIYAAADHVVFPSTWEGFGNPPVEAAMHRRTVTVGDYPVAEELRAHGFDWYRTDDADSVRTALAEPGSAAVLATLDRNEEVARRDFSLEGMARTLTEVLGEAGWMP